MIRRRAGFTFIELLTVMIVIGLLAGIALLKYIDLRHRARAAQAAADLQAVRLAAYGAWYETGKWPAEVGAGRGAARARAYLPTGFTFQRNRVHARLGKLRARQAAAQTAGMQVGVVVIVHRRRGCSTRWSRRLGNKLPFINVGGTLTFIIVGPDGKS